MNVLPFLCLKFEKKNEAGERNPIFLVYTVTVDSVILNENSYERENVRRTFDWSAYYSFDLKKKNQTIDHFMFTKKIKYA